MYVPNIKKMVMDVTGNSIPVYVLLEMYLTRPFDGTRFKRYAYFGKAVLLDRGDLKRLQAVRKSGLSVKIALLFFLVLFSGFFVIAAA